MEKLVPTELQAINVQVGDYVVNPINPALPFKVEEAKVVEVDYMLIQGKTEGICVPFSKVLFGLIPEAV